jgi:hypothetical protein
MASEEQQHIDLRCEAIIAGLRYAELGTHANNI